MLLLSKTVVVEKRERTWLAVGHLSSLHGVPESLTLILMTKLLDQFEIDVFLTTQNIAIIDLLIITRERDRWVFAAANNACARARLSLRRVSIEFRRFKINFECQRFCH